MTELEKLEAKEKEISLKIELGRWNLLTSPGRPIPIRNPKLCAMKSDCIKAIAGFRALEFVNSGKIKP